MADVADATTVLANDRDTMTTCSCTRIAWPGLHFELSPLSLFNPEFLESTQQSHFTPTRPYLHHNAPTITPQTLSLPHLRLLTYAEHFPTKTTTTYSLRLTTQRMQSPAFMSLKACA